jgi:hypothetical protein
MRILLRLYPRAWRARYGEELAMLLSDQRPSLRLVVDVLAGAIDAHLNPQLAPAESGHRKGETTMSTLFAHCRAQELTAAEYRQSAAVMIGATLVLSGIYLGLKRAFGDTAWIDAFGVSTFPTAVLLSSWKTYFKPYSRTARTIMIVGTAALVFVLSLVATFVAERT